MDQQKLDIQGLWERHRGVSRGIASAYSEAVSVCLHKQHSAPVHYDLRDNNDHHEAVVEWEAPTAELIDAWGNDIDVVEWAAYGLALAGMELTRGLVALGRAETKSGADYYLGLADDGPNDLETVKRLEVSGVGAGAEAAIQSRLKKKLLQTAQGASDVPAVASIVGFGTPLILSADLTEG